MDRLEAADPAPPGEMSTRELISRLMDGDIEEHEVELALRTLDTEAGRQIWAELHAVGDCLRGLPPASARCQQKIFAALAAEPPILAPAPRRERLARQATSKVARPSLWSRFQRDGRLLAAAASIAAVGFVATASFELLRSPAAPSSGSMAASSAPTPAVHTGPTDWNAYLRAHQESIDATSLHAVRQYLRPVSTQVSE